MRTEIFILKILSDQAPRLLNVGTLWSDVLMVDGGIGYSGFKAALRALEEKEQVVVIHGEDRDKAKITDAGMARLAENGL